MTATRTRSLPTALCALALSLPALSGAQTRDVSETIALDSGGRLSVDGSKGSITLTAWDRDEVQVQARIEAPKNVSGDYAQRAVDATKVRVTGGGGSVAIRSDYADVPKRSTGDGRSIPEIHYEIRAPKNIRLSVDSDRGPLRIEGFEGSFEIDADRGEMALSNLTGEMRVDVDRGSDSRIASLRGSFRIDADRTNVRMDDLRIESDSQLEIDRGDVSIDLDPSQGLNLKAELSRRAELETELPVTTRSIGDDEFEGTLNGGGPELYIESDRGSITLESR